VRYFNKRIEEHLNASLADRTSLTYNSHTVQSVLNGRVFYLWSETFFASKRHSLVPVLGVADRVGRS
jgi:hypothetical protein